MLEHQKLLQQLSYDSQTGIFLWRVTRHRITIGTQAGFISDKGYRIIRLYQKTYKAHRLAWFYVHGVWPTGIIDHRDGIGDHNWIKNLRDTTQQVNCENKKVARKKSTSTLMGVSYVPKLNKFKAQIVVKGVYKYLGVFHTEQAAHDAYMEEKKLSHQGFV